MCGIIAVCSSSGVAESTLSTALATLDHRGPDDVGVWVSKNRRCGFGHRRLSIIDLSRAGRQPFRDASGRYRITFNGEIYNYVELRAELEKAYPFETQTDTEVLLAAWSVWGPSCLDRLIGMFAFAIWDDQTETLTAVRDRFGVKPLFYATDPAGAIVLASEIKALHAAGIAARPDARSWCAYLRDGLYDHTANTFWEGVKRVPPGHLLQMSAGSLPRIESWYEPGHTRLELGEDDRTDDQVYDELDALLKNSLRLRFRADVPVGICLSGGLDSSLVLGLIRYLFSKEQIVQSFTFICNDPRYDEDRWVQQMVAGTQIHANYCRLTPECVPHLAEEVQASQDEPFGGFPTLGMACVHARARELGITVLLDGNGVDESWAGYDYYRRASQVSLSHGVVQGTQHDAHKETSFLQAGFFDLAPSWTVDYPFEDSVLNLQYRDIAHTKITRAMRFADRVSMQYSRELREPFLDHRLVELGLRQPTCRRIRDGQGKWLVRQVAADLLPSTISEAPKRPVQTPQREWLRGPLANWADLQIRKGLSGWGRDWLDERAILDFWRRYRDQGADNSFPIWQWINLGLMQR